MTKRTKHTNMNSTSHYELTIIVPVYNEEDNIDAVEQRLGAFLPKSLRTACVLFVNDGSTDKSLDGIRKVCRRYTDFFYVSLKKNSGLSAALKAGIDQVESPLVGYIDADLQTDPDDFNLLLQQLPGHALVTGIRANRKDSAFKKLQSRIANGFRRAMTGDGAKDTGCPLKVMQTAYARRIPFFKGLHRFLPAMIMLQNGTFAQVPVRHYPRTAGVSKYHLWNRLVGPFIDCFAYRWMRSRYINYAIAEENIDKTGGK